MFDNLFDRKRSCYLVFDIGGTKIRLAVTSDLEKIDKVKIIPTNKDFKEAMEEVKQVAYELSEGKRFKAGAGGTRALNKTKDRLLPHPHFPLWEDEPLRDALQEILDAPVFLENDAAVAGLGEAAFGPGKGKRIVAYHTFSTGIGGIRITDKNIDLSSMGFEPGNQIIDADGSLMGRKQPVYLEGFIGGNALRERFKKLPQDIDDPKVWDEVARMMAVGLTNSIVYWSPDIIVLGGSVIKKVDLDKVRKYVREYVKIFPELPEIVKGELGEENGLYGSMAYLKGKAF